MAVEDGKRCDIAPGHGSRPLHGVDGKGGFEHGGKKRYCDEDKSDGSEEVCHESAAVLGGEAEAMLWQLI